MVHAPVIGLDDRSEPQVQGVFYPGADGTDINSVHISASKRAVVAGDDDSTVRLYRYVCRW